MLQKGISPSPVSFWPVILRRCSSSSQSKSQRPRLTSRLGLNHSFKQTNRFSSAAVETSDIEIEDEIESTRVSPAKKRKNMFQDTGAESRKKRLLCQRSTEKYRDLEEEMKCYIQSMFNSSFTALGLEVCEFIKDRFIKLEEKILSSQTQGGAPANTQTRGDDPFWTPSAAAAAATASVPTEAPPSCSFCSFSQLSFCDCSHWWSCECCEDKSQTKDADLSDVFGSLFSTLDVNVGTQEHLQKTMGNLTQESKVDGFDPTQDKHYDLEVRCKAKDYELVFLPEDKWAKLIEWTSIPQLASRIIGPNIWLKNFDMDAMMYLFRERTALPRWRPDRVTFMNCMFSNQIITAYGKFDGNKRGYKIDDNFLEYGRDF
ncbi:hypothetical protein HID58_074826 [Brassica napus]|uniref:Uncharacterized protein n=1 Tax=Brassica napus TaxID=3708 RepID=A0ABQ7YHW9_BRANA|nr:hypothetical protein HID58_074826 [Brassica napus]